METNVAVLVDAKNEYSKQLVQIVSPHLLSGLLTIYDEAYGVCASNKEEDLTMLTFQELLGEVPAWNNVMVAEEAERITDESKCDYLEDIITAVFVCHTKILTTVRVTNKDRKINLKIPSVENFLHQVYIEMAREFWKHPYLLNPSEVSKLDYQHNLQVAEDKICACVEATVRKLLPVKDILKEYLAEEDDDVVDGATASDNPDEMASSPSRSSKAEATTTKADADVTIDNLKETLTDKLKDKIKNDLDTFKKDDAIVVDTAKASGGGAQTGGGDTSADNGSSVSSAFNSMLDAIAGKSDGGSSGSGTDIKSIAVGGGGGSSSTPTLSASPPVTSASPPASPVAGGSSPTTTGSTELSLDSLTSGGSSSSTTTPLSSMMTAGSTTSASSEISLDSLGSIEEVKVDYGQPSSSSSSTPSVQSSVMSEFDKMAASKTAGGGTPAPAPAPAPTTSYSFF